MSPGQRLSGISGVPPTIGVPYSKVGNDGVGSDYAIWHVPFAGGVPFQLTAGTGQQQETPIVDPVGRDRCAYLQRILGGDFEIWMVSATGGDEVQVEAGYHRELDWKPDGSKLMFTIYDESIYEINPDGTGRTAIYSSTVGDYITRPKYSPDGSQIAFFNAPSGSFHNGEVWVMDSDGTNAVQVDTIDDGSVMNNAIAWSPDGSQIAYGDGGHIFGGFGHWYVINADGTGKTDVGSQNGPLNTARAYGSRDMWVPDGSAILVDYWTGDNRWSLLRCEADGSGQSLLSPTLHVFDRPSLFFPNDRMYTHAYIEPVFSGTDLESVLADGSDRRVEDDDSAVNILLEWFE